MSNRNIHSKKLITEKELELSMNYTTNNNIGRKLFITANILIVNEENIPLLTVSRKFCELIKARLFLHAFMVYV